MELNYKELGTGEPLIILHGLFGTLDNWLTIARQLSQHFMVYLIDQRNHGRSPHTDGDFNYHILAEDLHQFMEQHWLYGGANIVGHSMGGKVAMQFALSYPDLVKKLAIIDIAPKRYRGEHGLIFEALEGLPLHRLESRQMAEDYLMDKLAGEIGVVQFLLKNLSRKLTTEGGGFEWKMNWENLKKNYEFILDTVGNHTDKYIGETLFVSGAKSNYIKEKDKPMITSLFPHAQIATIANAGHWVHADAPQELFKILEKFLL